MSLTESRPMLRSDPEQEEREWSQNFLFLPQPGPLRDLANDEDDPFASSPTPVRSYVDEEGILREPEEKPTASGKRSISAFRLAMITYFFTCGGPFGIESAVGAAGPLYSLIAVFVIPLFWALPQALMSAELALMMNQNGGNIIWVRRAFGLFVGWINAYNYLTNAIASMALYVILFVDYLPGTFPYWQALLLKFGFVFVLTLLNLWGITWISRLSLFFLIFVLLPFGAEYIAAPILNNLKFEDLKETEPIFDIQWGVFLSTVLWSYGGYDSMGSFAGEVKGGRKTFMTGIVIGIPLAIVNYLFPLVIGYAVHPKYEDWQSGYFTTVAYDIANWMGIWVVAASVISNFGTYNVAMASVARVIWACGKGPKVTKLMPGFVAWSYKSRSGTVRPVAAILLVGGITFALSLLSYNILVQLTMTVRIVNLLLEYAALIYLKWSEPDTPRPFQVPGGKIGAILLTIPTVILCGILLAGADWELWVTLVGINVVVVVLYLFRSLGLWIYYKYFDPKKKAIALRSHIEGDTTISDKASASINRDD